MSEMRHRIAEIIRQNAEFPEMAAELVLEAMREPTEAMVAAGTAADWVGEVEGREGWSIVPSETPDYYSEDPDVMIKRPGIWRAMIDAALKN